MDFQKAQKEKLRFWQVLGHVVHFIHVYELSSSLRGENVFKCTFFHIPLLTQLDPTDKSLLTVYVITVEKFVKSQIWQHGFTNILE